MCGSVQTDMDREMALNPQDFERLFAGNLPNDVFGGGPEDERLQAAAREANEQGSQRPLVMEELRNRILLRRHHEGKPQIQPESTPPQDYQLTPAEKEKKERRKEQNRRAAKKCREKKKNEESEVRKKHASLAAKNKQLRQEVELLHELKDKWMAWWMTHIAVCNIQIPQQRQQDWETPHNVFVIPESASELNAEATNDQQTAWTAGSQGAAELPGVLLDTGSDALLGSTLDPQNLPLQRGHSPAQTTQPTSTISSMMWDTGPHAVQGSTLDPQHLSAQLGHCPAQTTQATCTISSVLWDTGPDVLQGSALDPQPLAPQAGHSPAQATQPSSTISSQPACDASHALVSHEGIPPPLSNASQARPTSPTSLDLPGYPFSRAKKRKSPFSEQPRSQATPPPTKRCKSSPTAPATATSSCKARDLPPVSPLPHRDTGCRSAPPNPPAYSACPSSSYPYFQFPSVSSSGPINHHRSTLTPPPVPKSPYGLPDSGMPSPSLSIADDRGADEDTIFCLQLGFLQPEDTCLSSQSLLDLLCNLGQDDQQDINSPTGM